jgi:DNA segregation ATPase FtsK/SpoIIIE-like protein
VGFGAPFARWFASEEEDEDDMEGASVGGGPSKVVKFTGSNRVMRLSELKNMVYQKTLAGGSKRPQSAHTMTQVEKFGVLRECCDGEARVLLHDHFQSRIDRNREEYEAVEAENLQLEAQMRAAWQRAYDAYIAELAAREQAQAQAQAQAAQAPAPAAAPGAGAANAPAPPPAPAGAAAQVALPPLQLPVHHVPPKKPPPDDPTIMMDAYALLERTFPEVTPEVHKRYLYFKHTAGKTTIMTLHELRELCRLTKNPTEGRLVVEKAINALSDQLRKVLEAEVL